MWKNNLLLSRQWKSFLCVKYKSVPHIKADGVLYNIILQIILVLPLTQKKD